MSDSKLKSRLFYEYLKERFLFLGTGVAVVALYFFSTHVMWFSDRYIHTFLDVIATTTVWIAGLILLIYFFATRKRLHLYFSAAILGTAFLDLYHSFVSSYLFIGYLPGISSKIKVWSWFVPRLFMASAFVYIFGIIRHSVQSVETHREFYRVYGFIVGASLLFFIVFATIEMPMGYLAGGVFPRPQEFIPGILFVIAAILAYRFHDDATDYLVRWMIVSLILGAGAELFLMASSTQIHDSMFDLAHGFQILSYAAILVGIALDLKSRITLMRLLTMELDESNNRFKQVADELRFTSDRLALALEAGAVGIWEWDVRSNTLLWDHRMAVLYGVDKTEFVAADVWETSFHPDDKQRGIQDLQLALNGDKEFDSEFRIVWPDGSIRFIQSKGQVIREGIVPVKMIGLNWDITRAKQMEMQLLEQKEALERSNVELERFAYSVSHDLKAPLRGILQISDWIQVDFADRATPEEQSYLRLMQNRVGRMTHLIDGILRYSRVGRGDSIKEMVDLSVLVKDVAQSINTRPSIEIHIDPKMPSILCIRVQVEQVFQNLMVNAMTYIDKPQGLIEVGWAMKEGRVTFFVKDNGPGIQEKDFERIFEVFQTLTSKDINESTGIGLSIVKKVVEIHGGRVWVESVWGEGTTFFFTLG